MWSPPRSPSPSPPASPRRVVNPRGGGDESDSAIIAAIERNSLVLHSLLSDSPPISPSAAQPSFPPSLLEDFPASPPLLPLPVPPPADGAAPPPSLPPSSLSSEPLSQTASPTVYPFRGAARRSVSATRGAPDHAADRLSLPLGTIARSKSEGAQQPQARPPPSLSSSISSLPRSSRSQHEPLQQAAPAPLPPPPLPPSPGRWPPERSAVVAEYRGRLEAIAEAALAEARLKMEASIAQIMREVFGDDAGGGGGGGGGGGCMGVSVRGRSPIGGYPAADGGSAVPRGRSPIPSPVRRHAPFVSPSRRRSSAASSPGSAVVSPVSFGVAPRPSASPPTKDAAAAAPAGRAVAVAAPIPPGVEGRAQAAAPPKADAAAAAAAAADAGQAVPVAEAGAEELQKWLERPVELSGDEDGSGEGGDQRGELLRWLEGPRGSAGSREAVLEMGGLEGAAAGAGENDPPSSASLSAPSPGSSFDSAMMSD